MRNYKHSASFQTLKTHDETIKENFTSNQLITVLDNLLSKVINPIIESCDLVDRIFAIIIAWYSENSRRRISTLDKDKLNLLMFAFIATSNKKTKIKLYKRCRLERNISLMIAGLFLRLTTNYRSLTEEMVSCKPDRAQEITRLLRSMEREVSGGPEIYPAITEVTYWLDQTLEFKNSIIGKYLRYVVTQAKSYYDSSSRDLDLNDIVQNFTIAVSKAIDKFDPNKGALTSYIQTWALNAKEGSSSSHEYGIAYEIPQSKRYEMAKGGSSISNISVSIDSEEALEVEDTSAHDKFERDVMIGRIRMLARYADPTGIARMSLGIHEQLTDDEVKALLDLSQE